MDKMMMIENKVSTTGSLIIDAATPPSLARTVQGSMNAEIKKARRTLRFFNSNHLLLRLIIHKNQYGN